jgi:hypothetical protein
MNCAASKFSVQVADVNEVMRHAGAFGGRRLGGADVESAINLHGIGGDDFAADFFREGSAISDFPTAVGPAMKDGGFISRAHGATELPPARVR